MSVPISGVPDGNSKPSLTVIDQTTHEPFAVIGDSNLGVPYIQIVDNANNPLGTATHPLYTQLIAEPTINIGEVELTDGTNTANILKSDGTAAGQNALITAGTSLAVPFTTTTIQPVATTDVSNYKTVAVHITSQGTGSTVNFQASNDNVNWQQLALQNANATVSSLSGSETGSNILRYGALNFRYFRLNITGISAGTTAGVILFSTQPGAYSTVGVAAAQNGTWTVGANSANGSAVPANSFYIGVKDGSGNLQGVQSPQSLADGSGIGSAIAMGGWVFNGTNWDRFRSNQDVTLLASAAQTTTQTSADIINYNGKSALIVVLDMTTVGTGSVTVSIDGKDTASGKYYNILTGAAITTNSTNRYRIGPDLAAAANSVAQDYLPRTFRIVVTANNANSATYSVGYSLVRG